MRLTKQQKRHTASAILILGVVFVFFLVLCYPSSPYSELNDLPSSKKMSIALTYSLAFTLVFVSLAVSAPFIVWAAESKKLIYKSFYFLGAICIFFSSFTCSNKLMESQPNPLILQTEDMSHDQINLTKIMSGSGLL